MPRQPYPALLLLYFLHGPGTIPADGRAEVVDYRDQADTVDRPIWGRKMAIRIDNAEASHLAPRSMDSKYAFNTPDHPSLSRNTSHRTVNGSDSPGGARRFSPSKTLGVTIVVLAIVIALIVAFVR
jgi:hypothetical protein